MINKIALSISILCVVAGATFTNAQNVGEFQDEFVTSDDLFAEVARRVPGFGGFFLDQEGTRFNIYLLEPRTEDAAIEAIGEVYGANYFQDNGLKYPPDDIRVLIGQYDYQELLEWNIRTRDLLSLPGISLKGIDEGRNRLLIGLEREGARQRIQDALKQLGVPDEAVIIEVTDPVRQLNHTLTSSPPVRPTVGGLQIDDGDGAACSLGFNVIREATGRAGFVTNSHCTVEEAGGSDGRPIYQLDTVPPTNRLGVETVDPPYFDTTVVSRCPAFDLCRWSDAAFILYDEEITRSQGHIARVPLGSIGVISHAQQSFRISAESMGPMMGITLYKIGQSTGHTQGIVEQTCMDMPAAAPGVTLLCQASVRGAGLVVALGDSGAPVFRNTNQPEAGDVTLHGILWGQSSTRNYFFSAIRGAGVQNIRDLGELKTCGLAFSC